MKINHIIVHSVEKEQLKENIELHIRDEELKVEDRVLSLLDGIRKVYNKKTGKAYGVLGDTRPFSRDLRRFYEGELEFIKFTDDAMNALKGHMAAQSFATGGYLLFVDYDSHATNYFMIIMLKSKDGLSFDDELELMDAHQLDLDRLHFAARIDVEAWRDGEDGNNVSFVKGRASTTVTLYFKEFLGIEEFSESVKITQDFVNAVTNFYRQELKKDSEEIEINKKLIHDYCRSRLEKDEAIYLDELSRYLDEHEPTRFLEYAQEKYNIPNEFRVDANKLRKFLRYSGKDKSVSVSFTSEVFGSRVKYDSESDMLTIHRVPATLKAQLSSEIKKQPKDKKKADAIK